MRIVFYNKDITGLIMDISFLGADQQPAQSADYLTAQHAAKMGVHDAVRDITKYLVIGGTIIAIGAIVFRQKDIERYFKRLTR